jgi:hypothetical protein
MWVAAGFFFGIVGVQAVFVLDEDGPLGAQELGRQEHAGVGAVRRDAAALLALLPVAERRHAAHDRDAAELEVQRQLLEVVGHDVQAAVLGEQHLHHARVLHRDVLAERGHHADRHLELAGDRVDVAGAGAAADQHARRRCLPCGPRPARRGSGTARRGRGP